MISEIALQELLEELDALWDYVGSDDLRKDYQAFEKASDLRDKRLGLGAASEESE